jgi:general secretion pathway protein A
MYSDYFRLTQMPFSIAPDPRFLFMSERHREALAHLLYGVQGEGGILLLTGEVGTGKTTLCRCLLEQIDAQCDVAFILNPKMSVEELLAAICDEFHVDVTGPAASVKVLVDSINRHLLRANAEGRRAVLIIDEAQNLRPDVLEQLRLLTNLETNTRKLLQIILIGQPELQDMLRRPELRQVAQRIVARYHLTHLTRLEVAAYVAHRLRVSGTQLPIIPYSLIGQLYRLTGGVPRLINLICDRALLGAYVQRQMQVTPKTMKKAAREVLDVSARPRLWQRRLLLPIGIAAVCSGAFAAGLLPLPAWQIPWPASVQDPAPSAISASPPAAERPRPAEQAPAPVQAVRAAAAPPPMDELRWPDDTAPRSRSEGLAFQALLNLYGITYEPGSEGSACRTAEARNMRCLQARGGLSELRYVNQPAVLVMDGSGKERPFHALLMALDEDSATFLIAGAARRVALADMAQQWSGRYVLLWQAPPGFGDALSAGSRGPGVTWLRQALVRLHGGDAQGPAWYDAELAARVKAFQMAQGMVPDGVADVFTIIRLNMLLDQSLPRLTMTALGGSNVVHP